jgi:hypothetical protein
MSRPKEERMKRPSSTLCLLVLLGGLCLTACGGGGGNVPPGGGLITAAFTPSNPAPGVDSISMQPGTATNDTFQIVVNVTDIVDFFGAAFRIVFDSTTAEFLSFDDSTSFLHNHPDSPVVDIRAVIDPADPDSVLVVATLQQTFLYIPGFTFTAPNDGDQVLLILTFRATSPTAGNPFTFGIAATREVSTCEPPPMIGPTPACIMVADGTLTWNGGTMSAN